jgi:hypothetical protein
VTQIVWGLALTAALAGLGWAAWGPAAVAAIVVFGSLATAIQMAAVALLRPVWNGPFRVVIKRWAVGMALRVGGIVTFAVAVTLNRALFPPLAAALGYLGVIVPLLFMETRFLKRQGF